MKNAEKTNTSFICEFNLMHIHDYKAQSTENSKTKGIRQKCPILKYLGSGCRKGGAATWHRLACQIVRQAHEQAFTQPCGPVRIDKTHWKW